MKKGLGQGLLILLRLLKKKTAASASIAMKEPSTLGSTYFPTPTPERGTLFELLTLFHRFAPSARKLIKVAPAACLPSFFHSAFY